MVIKANPDTVLLKARHPERLQGIATEQFTPGYLLSYDGVADAGALDEPEFGVNTDDAAKTALHVALEYQKTGRGIDQDYEDGDDVEYKTLETGDRFYGFVFGGSNAAGSGTDLSANANISAGDRLVAYGGAGEGGTFRAFDGDDEGAVLVEAKEAVDNSAAGEPARIRLEVL